MLKPEGRINPIDFGGDAQNSKAEWVEGIISFLEKRGTTLEHATRPRAAVLDCIEENSNPFDCQRK